MRDKYDHTRIIGRSQQMQMVFRLIEKVSRSDATVLVTGKSGTGKELVARAIHRRSARGAKPFVALNCGAIPESLMESELFGYRRGAFTGAVRDKDGYFRYAHGGTLLLDEIGEFPTNLQVKLLRALETHEIVPVGDTRPVTIDTRIIAATNRDLAAEVEAGRFREDLFYRLNVVEIPLPGLSERPEDVPLLIDHFIEEFNRELHRNVRGVEDEAMDVLLSHEWRGGVRELENAIERAMTLCEGEMISKRCLPLALSSGSNPSSHKSLKLAVAQFEKQFILQTLSRTGGDKRAASGLLGIGLSSLYRKIEEHGIDVPFPTDRGNSDSEGAG